MPRMVIPGGAIEKAGPVCCEWEGKTRRGGKRRDFPGTAIESQSFGVVRGVASEKPCVWY